MTQDRSEQIPDLDKAAVPVAGQRVHLRPVTPADTPFIMEMECTGQNAAAYRHRGQGVSPEQFSMLLWQGVLSQFIVARNEDRSPCGLVVCYGADFRNQNASIAAVFRPDLLRAAWPLEGVELFFSYLFTVFPFRKLYAEASGLTSPAFSSGVADTLHLEATLKEHDWYDGRWWDKHIYAIYRDEWLKHRDSEVRGGLAAALLAAAAEEVHA